MYGPLKHCGLTEDCQQPHVVMADISHERRLGATYSIEPSDWCIVLKWRSGSERTVSHAHNLA